MTHTIQMFLKFGSYGNIIDLYENGTVFINTLEYFRNIEDKELRGDKYEGASKIINSLPGTFKIPGLNGDFNFKKIHVKEAYEKVLGNVYSLYCISSFGFPNPLEFKIDERVSRFGTHCLMIKDNVYFFEQVKKELQSQGLKFRHGFVKYYDKEKVSKDLTLFEKPLEFEYQKEFRFYVENREINSINIQVGSLKSYSEIYTMEDILHLKLENQI